ncbi:AfsR/SARP family transcriptional regulator [Kribbella jiaozuonensis]|uniref:Tetratricopeptide repeat protein n=1 Tax=Kribbella jiaozuonensis TaxID=2575441 RepID=A0A4U3LEF4_9ACTN|nr:BTAD domain-containing putative transcriptional regulator [Kribbella jiaozuonensis]TKK73602.1 tetratricopeptide repeat protein [Kribbella jiaozuonensis]
MTDDLRLDLLGPLRGWAGERRLDLGPIRQQTLLAVLALRPNQVISADELVELVWSDAPPSTGAKIVPPYIYRLRKLLPEGVLVHTRDGYSLRLAPGASDLERFESLVSAGHADRDKDRAAARLSEALELFTGEPFSGLAGHYLSVQRHRLTERRLKVLAERIELDLERGRYGDLVPELVALVEEDRLREQFAGQLMLAYWRSGRISEALDTYTRTRQELVEQLGVEPGPELRAIHERILQNDEPLARPAVRDELPYDGAAFVGRDDVLRQVVDALHTAGPAVVAIDGMAGVGKTALAVRAARQLGDVYPDGRLFIDLHGYTPGHEPVSALQALDRLLRTLSVPAERIPADLEERAALWRSELAGRRILVVLDNAPDSAAVRPLLAGGPRCGVLVTSRRQLTGLDATARLALDVLRPEDARELLAEIVGPDRAGSAGAAAEVVSQCGHLPLAIRVAGARLRHRPSWTIEHLSKRLDAEDRRLAELSTDSGGVSPAFALSYESLPPDQQRLFRLLGAMTGQDIEMYAAAALADLDVVEAEDLLEQLVDANLLLQLRPGRFQFHDLLRQYARTLAPEPDAVRRLLDYYLYATAEASAAIFGSRLHPLPEPAMVRLPEFASVADGLAWIDAEGANVLATIRYSESSGALEQAWRTGLSVASCFFQRGQVYELDEAHQLSLRAAEGDAEAESRVLLSIGSLGRYRLGAEESLRTLLAARDKLPENADLTLRARLLASIGYSQAKLRPDEEALAVLDDALEASRQAGDRSIAARVLAYVGVTYSDRLEFAQALTAYQESLAEGDPGVQAEVLNGIGECLLELDRVDEAVTALTNARDLGVERGSDYSLIYTYAFLGTAYARRRQWSEALDFGRQAVELAQDSDSTESQQNAYVRLAETLLAKGDLARARPHFARAMELAVVDGQESMILRAASGLARTSPAA